MSFAEWLARWQMMLKAIAQTGLAFTQSPYERERYEELLKLAAEMAVVMGWQRDDDESIRQFVERWKAELKSGAQGYVTPKVVINSAVFDEQNRLLLIQRSDRGTWFLPGGWADVGYPPSEIAVKEVREETGLLVEPLRLIAILDGFKHKFSLGVPFYCLVYECKILDGQLRPLPHECKDAGFFNEKELPNPLHGDGSWAWLIFELKKGNLPIPYSD